MRLLCSLPVFTTVFSLTQGVDHRVQEGLEHPNAHIHGFVISDVFVRHTSKTTGEHSLTQRKLKFNDNPHLPRRHLEDVDLADYEMFDNLQAEIESLDASADITRDKVRALAKLAFINMGWDDDGYPGTDFLGSADLILGAADVDEMLDLVRTLFDLATAEVEAVAAGLAEESDVRKYDTPPSDFVNNDNVSVARNDVGICALIFRRGTDTIITFRDTKGKGDDASAAVQVMASVMDTDSELGSTAAMKRNWIASGLEWEEEQEERASESDWYVKTLFSSIPVQYILMGSLGKDLYAAVNGRNIGDSDTEISVTKEETREQGYWPVIRSVIDQVRKDMPANGRLLFSGYSQGGGNAQMARMYTEKKYDEKWPVITFAAIGAACYPRGLTGIFMKDLLADVDPTRYYEDVTDYQNVLDIYGASYGQDIGRSCNIGGYDIATNKENSKQYKYCKEVYGYSARRLQFDEFIGIEPLKTKSKLCRWMGHQFVEIMRELANDNELKEDGDTYLGCTQYEGAAMDSDKCPTEPNHILNTGLTVVAIVPIVLIIVFRMFIIT